MENNNFKFKKLQDKIKLSKNEKNFHREKILKFMNDQDLVQSPYFREQVPSSFQFIFFIKKHFIITSLVIVCFLSTTIAVSADHAIPNDYLYQVRVKIVEPTKILLAPTAEKKNDLRVKFVNKALKDFSQVSEKEEINEPDKKALIDSVSSNIQDINIEIANEKEEVNTSNSLKIANDLKSVLSAHNIVLDKMNESNSENITEDLSAKINEGLGQTEETISQLTETIQNSSDLTKLDQTIIDQKEEINTSLNNIENNKKNPPSKNNSEENNILNIQNEIDTKLSEIDLMTKEGDIKLEEGNKKEAVDIYNQVDQKVGELESLIESSQNLNIKILNDK